MVEHREVDCLGSKRKPPRQKAVVGAWRRVPARMIMRQDHPNAPMGCGIGNHVAQGQVRAANVSVMPRQVDAPRLIVDMGDPQMFLVRTSLGEAAREESMGGLEAIEEQRGFGTLMKHGHCLVQADPASDANRIRCG
ncbi:MAG: hypothetical protein ABIR87_00885 [Sphingomicrobium sp.]